MARAKAAASTRVRSAWKSWKRRPAQTASAQGQTRSSCNSKSPGSRGCGRSRSRSRPPMCTATTDTGSRLNVTQPEAMQDVEVPTGTQAAEITLPFELPARDVKKIATLHGKLHALGAGPAREIRIRQSGQAAGKSQQARRRASHASTKSARTARSGKSTCGSRSKRRMAHCNRTAVGCFRTFRTWSTKMASESKTPAWKPRGKRPNEVGVAYLFDVPDGLDGLTWVYETPAAIVDCCRVETIELERSSRLAVIHTLGIVSWTRTGVHVPCDAIRPIEISGVR